MMRTPTDLELEQLAHLGLGGGVAYDPVKAHEYYLRTRKLHPRQKGAQPEGFARANARRHEGAKAQQKRDLQARIEKLSKSLAKLEALIREKEHAAASENRKSKAKKERAAKEKDKPQTAAEKAKAARENEKYRKKHKQELQSKAKKASKSGGGSHKPPAVSKSSSLSELKALATKVKGQIAVAKQKLAAL